MNRINQLFQKESNRILSVYFSAGFPHLNDTVNIIQTLERKGVDLIEIGIPFSDPLADGPIIASGILRLSYDFFNSSGNIYKKSFSYTIKPCNFILH